MMLTIWLAMCGLAIGQIPAARPNSTTSGSLTLMTEWTARSGFLPYYSPYTYDVPYEMVFRRNPEMVIGIIGLEMNDTAGVVQISNIVDTPFNAYFSYTMMVVGPNYIRTMKIAYLVVDTVELPFIYIPRQYDDYTYLYGKFGDGSTGYRKVTSLVQKTGKEFDMSHQYIVSAFISGFNMSKMTAQGDFALEVQTAVVNSSHINLTLATNGTTQVYWVQHSELVFDKTAVEQLAGQYLYDFGSVSGSNGVQQTWPSLVAWPSNSFMIGLRKFYFGSGSPPSFLQQTSNPWTIVSTSGYVSVSSDYFNFRTAATCPPSYSLYNTVNNTCWSTCPPGTLTDPINNLCYVCHYSCAACTGPSPNNCTSCPENSTRHLQNGSTCACDKRYYDDGEARCGMCSYQCETCEKGYGGCLSCGETRVMDSTGYCPCVPGYLDVSLHLCQKCDDCLDCTKDPYSTGFNYGKDACRCKPRYLWVGFCILYCPDIEHSTGNRNGPQACFCKEGYAWDGKGCSVADTVNCTQGGDGGYDCSCLPNFSWNRVANVCEVDCGIVANSKGQNGFGECFCLPGFLWTGIGCDIDCKLIAHANAITVGTNTCQCEYGYSWSSTDSVCQLNCSTLSSTNGTVNASTCQCSSSFLWQDNKCVVICSQVSNTVATNSTDPSGCVCSAGYYWNSSASQCFLNCSDLANTFGNINGTTCNCARYNIWNASLRACAVACGSLPNTDGTTASPTVCGCASEYSWNGTGCTVASAINCSEVANSNGTSGDNKSCRCVAGYFWNSDSCFIQCANVANSRGFNNDSESCLCSSGYSWTNKTCAYDCSAVSGSTGNADANRCKCQFGYLWRGSSCVKNCSSEKYTNGTDTWDPSVCRCLDGYARQGDSCVLTCKGMSYSAGEKKSNGECKCSSGYRWDKGISMCVAKDSSSSTGVAVGVGVGVPVGLGVLAAIALLAYSSARRPAPPIAAPLYAPISSRVVTVSTAQVISGPQSQMGAAVIPVVPVHSYSHPLQNLTQSAVRPTRPLTSSLAAQTAALDPPPGYSS